jgi:uncharacterized protein
MRHFILYIAVFISFSVVGCGQNEKKEKTVDDKFIFPEKPIGWVSDFEKKFTPNEIAFLDSLISKHEEETTNQIAVVTYQLDSNLIKTDEDFDEFSLQLFKKWGVGTKEKENGIGILLSPNLRKVRIEVGYGLEAKLTNQEAKMIIDSIMIPEFKKEEYFKGVANGLNAIIKEIK